MANDKDPFYYNHHELNHSSFPFSSDSTLPSPQNFQGFVDPSYATFTDCLHGSMDYNTLSRAFDLSCSSSEVISSSIDDNPKKHSAGDSIRLGGNQSTPNSSVSSSSNEADAVTEEDSAKCKKDKQPKGCEDGDEKSKKEYVFLFFFFCPSFLHAFRID